MSTAKYTPTAWNDMRRDWDAWSNWEQRIVTALGCASSAAALVWFAFTVI
jgi:hypothetical protein